MTYALAATIPWSAAIALLGLIVTVLMLAMDERMRRKFLPREDATGMVQRLDTARGAVEGKVDGLVSLYTALEDRTGTIEEKLVVIEERQTQQWERVAGQMASTAKTIDDVTRRLELMSEKQQAHALRLERLRREDGR